jgi:hypothetical protein
MKNIIEKFIFQIKIWYPPNWFINPFFSPSLYFEYHARKGLNGFSRSVSESSRPKKYALDAAMPPSVEPDSSLDIVPAGEVDSQPRQ